MEYDVKLLHMTPCGLEWAFQTDNYEFVKTIAYARNRRHFEVPVDLSTISCMLVDNQPLSSTKHSAFSCTFVKRLGQAHVNSMKQSS